VQEYVNKRAGTKGVSNLPTFETSGPSIWLLPTERVMRVGPFSWLHCNRHNACQETVTGHKGNGVEQHSKGHEVRIGHKWPPRTELKPKIARSCYIAGKPGTMHGSSGMGGAVGVPATHGLPFILSLVVRCLY
jgi:hypothetical protein